MDAQLDPSEILNLFTGTLCCDVISLFTHLVNYQFLVRIGRKKNV